MRGMHSPSNESSLEKPRQLGLSRSHSFMSSPVGGANKGSSIDGDSGRRGGGAHLYHHHSQHYYHGASGDSLEGLATPMLNRRTRNESDKSRQEASERYRYEQNSRPLRPSASAHTALLHHTQHPSPYPHSDSSSSPSPPTYRHKVSPLMSPQHNFSLGAQGPGSGGGSAGSPHHLPDSGTSTLATDHTCCSPHASHHSLFDSGHMSIGTTGSRGSDNVSSSRNCKSLRSDKSDAATSPTASSTAHSERSGRSKGSSTSSHLHHHHRKHHCPKHAKADKSSSFASGSQITSVGNLNKSSSPASTSKSINTTTDSDTLQTNSSHHTNTSNNTSHNSPNNTNSSTPARANSSSNEVSRRSYKNGAAAGNSSSSDSKKKASEERTDEQTSPQDKHHDLTHLYSNLEYVFDQPVYQYILEQAQLSGYSLGDKISGGDGDSLHSESDNDDRNDDSDHFADDEAVSNADSSSQENLDEINYLADDETYSQFFTPPPTATGKTTAVPCSPLPAVLSMKHASSLPVTTFTTTVTSSTVVSAASAAAAPTTTTSSSGKTVVPVSGTTSENVSGVVNILSGGGGVMGVGASSTSIAESLSRLSVNSSLSTFLQKQQGVSVVDGAIAEAGEGGSSVMEKYAKENLNIHTRGLLRKKVPVIDMISWTKDVIRKPLLSTVDKSLKGTACDMFRLVQVYMSDRKPKPGMTLNSVALDIVTMAYTSPSLRDELFVQLCKQTTDNHKKDSLRRGWELMAVALQFFPPSDKLSPHLACYINRHTDPAYTSMFPDVTKWPIHIQIAHYAAVCQKRLSRASVRPPMRKPCPIELDLAKLHIFRASMFGGTLQEIMQLQRDRYPHRRLPWVQTALSEEVLRLQGTNTEGIFRVPADNDEVQQIKQQVEQWEVGECSDAHVAAAVLKLWYRELLEPLIPNNLYEAAVEAHDKPAAALDLLNHLPHTNRLVLAYLIRFLQYFAQSEIVASTKMDASNLAMVIAPNCLRCTSDDPVVIYQNTRKEMAFMRLLIHNLDTTFMEGVV